MSISVSFRAARAVSELLPGSEVVFGPESVDELRAGAYTEPPRLLKVQCAEGSTVRAMRVVGDPQVRFGAFLDGIQRVKMLTHWRGVPVMHGTVAAVVRVRANRRFGTWGHRPPVKLERVYMPLAFLPLKSVTQAGGLEIVDTTGPDFLKSNARPSRHPAALRAVALDRVRQDREAAERQLAELWCVEGAEPIFIDGGISGSAVVERSRCAVGVIKSHQTLYADDEALDVVMSLRRGERSSAFRVATRQRSEVMSWYLRLHDPRGHDAMFGLVRVEVASDPDITERANEVSRWILAETTPLALPDNRWDRMTYGIRDCEEFLRAIA